MPLAKFPPLVTHGAMNFVRAGLRVPVNGSPVEVLTGAPVPSVFPVRHRSPDDRTEASKGAPLLGEQGPLLGQVHHGHAFPAPK